MLKKNLRLDSVSVYLCIQTFLKVSNSIKCYDYYNGAEIVMLTDWQFEGCRMTGVK